VDEQLKACYVQEVVLILEKKTCQKPFKVSEVLQAQEEYLQKEIQSNQTNNRSSTSMQIEP